jgi:outer membrane lipoprotein SlyB
MFAVAAIHRWALALGCALSVGAALALPTRADEGNSYAAAATYGTVRSIERVGGSDDRRQGAGALVGGILGAVIGRQFAEGSAGKNVGAAVGAVAGALIGNEIEKSARRDRPAVRIAVILDDGSMRYFDFRQPGDLHAGDRVRIEGNMLYRVS